jgi:hypothetical protein
MSNELCCEQLLTSVVVIRYDLEQHTILTRVNEAMSA